MAHFSQTRAGICLLGLSLCFTLPGTAAANRETTFDIFTFRKAADALQVWQACNGSPAAAYESGAPAGLRFPGLFGTKSDRVYWDRTVNLDLRGYDFLELDLTCIQPDALRTFGLYLKSGDGWYVWLTPLKESGRQSLTFSLKDAGVEGKTSGWGAIDAVRISLTRDTAAEPEANRIAAVTAHALYARTCDLLVVQGTLSLANAGEKIYARSMALRISHWLQNQGIAHSLVDDEAVVDGRLKSAQVAILPYNALPPGKEMRALGSFVKSGGKLVVFYSAEPDLAKLMGLKLGSYQAARFAGQWSGFAFNRNAPPYMPEVVYQDSSNIFPAFPADKDSQVIAFWQNSAGKESDDPAWVQSSHGFWMSHVLLDSDAANKQRMLLAMLGTYSPSIWEQAAARVMVRAGKVGPFGNLNDATAGITRMARDTAMTELVDNLLAQCSQDYRSMAAAQAKRKYPEVVETGRRLQAKLVEAFARVQRPKKQEFSGVWDHTGLGLYPGNWSKTARILADSGMNAVFVNVAWPGLAHYDSQVMPQSDAVRRYGDQLKQCVAAAQANNLEVHVWKVCWNLSNAPESFTADMRKAGRLQVNDAGQELDWLCPSNPDNVALELKSVEEVLQRYQVDGIHLDYVRYPDESACFCSGCRQRFGRYLGETIRNWPKSAQNGNLSGKYNAWRSEQITAFVRSVHNLAKKSGGGRSKRVRVSAAVYPEYPSSINSIGQDWGSWLKEGLVDFVCPMNYTVSNGAFKNLVRRQLALAGADGRIFPGLGVTSMESQLPADQVIEQIRQLREAGAGGFVLFDLNRTLEKDILPVLRMGITRP